MNIRTYALILAVFVFSVSFSFADDWPQWRGPHYDGVSKESINPTALNHPVIVWEAKIGTGFSAVSVANGKVYTVGNSDDTDIIYCLDALTGIELWTFTYPESLTPNMYEGGCNATPTVSDDKVYTLSKTGKTFCLDANTGKEIWKRTLPYKKPQWGFSSSPVIVDELVIYNVGAAGIAFNKTTGQVVWKSDDRPAGYASAVPFEREGKKYAALFCEKTLDVLETQTGKPVMTYPWETSYGVNAADPIVVGDEIFITSGYNFGAALLKMAPDGMQEIWRNKNMRSQMSGPVLIDGYVYGIDDNQLACVEWKTGKQMWTEKTPQKGSLCAAGDKLIVLGEGGMLSIVEAAPESYKELSSAQILSDRCWTMPVLANGKIYARNAVKGQPSRLVCVDVQTQNAPAEKTTVPISQNDWPQWQGPRRDNLSTETGLLKEWPQDGPKMLWLAEGLGEGYSTVSIAGGKLYTTGMIEKEGFLFCFDLNGKQLWKQSYGDEWFASFSGGRCTPTIENGQVYVASGFGKVTCFNAATGQQIWQKDPVTEFEGEYGRWGEAQSPLVVGGKVILVTGGPKAMAVALDAKDGHVVWTTPSNGDKSAYCSPLAIEWGGKTIIAGMSNKRIIGIDAANGNLLWAFAVNDYAEKSRDIHPNTPYFKDGCLFFTSGYDVGAVQLQLSPDATAVEKVWANSAFDVHHGGFVVMDGYIYGASWEGNKNGKWMCVDWKTGQTLYEQPWGNKGSMTYADGMLYCYEEGEGTVGLVKADPKEFTVISSFKITKGQKEHWAHPVICGKRLYIRHGDTLMAFDIAGRK